MFTPQEISRFFDGELDELLELTYDGSSSVVRIFPPMDGQLVARIPRLGGCSGAFRIEAALDSPGFGAQYEVTEDEYIVHITARHHVRSVIKFACNHLGWDSEVRLHGRLVPQGSGPNNSFKPKPLRGSA